MPMENTTIVLAVSDQCMYEYVWMRACVPVCAYMRAWHARVCVLSGRGRGGKRLQSGKETHTIKKAT